MKFKTLEEAQVAFDKVTAELNSFKKSVKDLTEELKNANTEKETAEIAAKEAIEQLNSAPVDSEKVRVTVGGKKYIIQFGVDGLTKEELAEDKEKLKNLVSGNSAALVLEG